MPEPQFTAHTRRASMPELSYRVRPVNPHDLPQLMDVRRDMKVHDCASCIETWSEVDPLGIRVIESSAGEIVGACSTVENNEDLCFLGLYCVLEKFRGCGMGIKVYKECMDHIGTRNACLNAVPGKMEMYRDKGGFPVVEHDFKCVKNFTTTPVDPTNLCSEPPTGVNIEPYHEDHLEMVLDYDYSLVGYDRGYALALSCTEKNSKTLVAVKNGTCVGFGTIKTSCLNAGRVGPLYADDPDVAEALLHNLITSLPDVTSFAMMTVSNNVSAARFLKKLNVPERERLTRMYSKKKVEVDTSKVFALFDLNFAPF